MQRFKLRAECFDDIYQFMTAAEGIYFQEIKRMDPDLPDTEMVFDSRFSKQQLLDILRKIQDSHVMVQTLEEIDKYTGERNFEIE